MYNNDDIIELQDMLFSLLIQLVIEIKEGNIVILCMVSDKEYEVVNVSVNVIVVKLVVVILIK